MAPLLSKKENNLFSSNDLKVMYLNIIMLPNRWLSIHVSRLSSSNYLYSFFRFIKFEICAEMANKSMEKTVKKNSTQTSSFDLAGTYKTRLCPQTNTPWKYFQNKTNFSIDIFERRRRKNAETVMRSIFVCYCFEVTDSSLKFFQR